ncbi:KIR protein [Plasmodium coatneyi]|uniref:KIR protein n=1 Tax=Plasmodium coatneyi TaxID=208452 RepID=A0A1B1E4S3_9APIC|nr:KIR protein [Plasmodium coatneyi]ANQ09779.1 KIR protein [Plasmodium coatneyi]
MEREKETYDNYLWDFFYYWVGTRIKEDLKGYDFTTTMRTICDKLPESEAKNICTNKYPEINKDLFEKAKVLFDFFYNYGTAKIKLQEKGLFTNEKCNSSLKKVKDAYQNIRDICDGEGDSKSQYCEKLIQEYKVKFQNGAPLKLTCPGDPAQADQSEDDGSGKQNRTTFSKITVTKHTEAEEEDEDDDYNDNDDEDDVEEEAVAADPGAAILPAVSGALATIGLPAVIFFLYKVSIQLKL